MLSAARDHRFINFSEAAFGLLGAAARAVMARLQKALPDKATLKSFTINA